MTEMVLPEFHYHADPIDNGVFIESAATCQCCQKACGWIYRGPVFAIDELEEGLCPWCIADGLAAAKFDASFVDDRPLIDAGLSSSVIEIVTRRTPGFNSCQQDKWLCHCGDACSYRGYPTADDLNTGLESSITALKDECDMSDSDWAQVCAAYVPGGREPRGRVGLYKFVCLHCGVALLGFDCD